MKRVLQHLIAGSLVVLFAGCSKNIDFASNDFKQEEKRLITTDSGYAGFIIKTITDNSNYYKRASIAYNGTWNPTKITLKNSASGYPNSYFTYSNGTKLLNYVTGFDNGGFELWHKYVYNGNVIARDSLFFFGTMTKHGPEDWIYVDIIDYTYDSFGRVNKTARTWYDGDSIVHTDVTLYRYDKDGNLVSGAKYDNRVNLHRVNNIWMFLACDYSVNNPFTAEVYTPQGLPQKMKSVSHANDRLSNDAEAKNSRALLHSSYVVGKPLGYGVHNSLKASGLPPIFIGTLDLNPGVTVEYLPKN